MLAACPSLGWRIKVLLSLCTGLRKSDLDGLPAASIDLQRMTLDMRAQKTGKAYVGRPLPEALELREKAKLPDITRQDFRRTFSSLMQRIGSIGSAQTLLEHSDSRITGEFYTDVEMVLRWKVNQLPVRNWLKPD